MFEKLYKELREITINDNDKIMLVIRKNIELGLKEKSAAVLRLLEVQQLLASDPDLSKDIQTTKSTKSAGYEMNGLNNAVSMQCNEENKGKRFDQFKFMASQRDYQAEYCIQKSDLEILDVAEEPERIDTVLIKPAFSKKFLNR